MTGDRPRIAVVTFPGSNDDGDACLALERLGAEAVPVWHTTEELPDRVGGVVLPGGFSYGDYLRCGALARVAPVMDAIRGFAGDGRPCARDLQRLPDPVRGRAPSRRPPREPPGRVRLRGRDGDGRVDSDAVHRRRARPATTLVIPIKHGEGNWVADDELAAEVEARGQVVLRYERDVNGSRDRVAGVANVEGNVLGLMPHPEHAVDPLLGPLGGVPLLEGLIAAARDRVVAAV